MKTIPDISRCLLTEADAARYISFSRSFLAKARSVGNMPGRTPAPPHLKLSGGAIRYLRADLDQWISEQAGPGK
jgi:predicted DNA-binding transcriptional regulator AlpA